MFKYIIRHHGLHVLVEEHLDIRLTWEKVARRKGLSLLTYKSPIDFLKDFDRFDRSTRFYLDQDFGPKNRGVGVALAHVIKERLGIHAFTCLITTYHPDDFLLERVGGVLDEVSNKYPEPFNPTRAELVEALAEADNQRNPH